MRLSYLLKLATSACLLSSTSILASTEITLYASSYYTEINGLALTVKDEDNVNLVFLADASDADTFEYDGSSSILFNDEKMTCSLSPVRFTSGESANVFTITQYGTVLIDNLSSNLWACKNTGDAEGLSATQWQLMFYITNDIVPVDCLTLYLSIEQPEGSSGQEIDASISERYAASTVSSTTATTASSTSSKGTSSTSTTTSTTDSSQQTSSTPTSTQTSSSAAVQSTTSSSSAVATSTSYTDISLWAYSESPEINGMGIASIHEGAGLDYLFLNNGSATSLKYNSANGVIVVPFSTYLQYFSVDSHYVALTATGSSNQITIDDNGGWLNVNGQRQMFFACKYTSDPYRYSVNQYELMYYADLTVGPTSCLKLYLSAEETSAPAVTIKTNPAVNSVVGGNNGASSTTTGAVAKATASATSLTTQSSKSSVSAALYNAVSTTTSSRIASAGASSSSSISVPTLISAILVMIGVAFA